MPLPLFLHKSIDLLLFPILNVSDPLLMFRPSPVLLSGNQMGLCSDSALPVDCVFFFSRLLLSLEPSRTSPCLPQMPAFTEA